LIPKNVELYEHTLCEEIDNDNGTGWAMWKDVNGVNPQQTKNNGNKHDECAVKRRKKRKVFVNVAYNDDCSHDSRCESVPAASTSFMH
jgi:hypothetical protein